MSKKEYFILPHMADKPFSTAVRAGDFIFVSGTGGESDFQGNTVIGIEAQTRQCLENLKRALEAAGALLSDIVKVEVFITKAEYWMRMNNVYRNYFPIDLPARIALVTEMRKQDRLIEMECIAYKPGETTEIQKPMGKGGVS